MMKFMMPSTLVFLLALLLAAAPILVQGHGYVDNVTIAGKVYTGWNPNTMPYTSPVGKSIVRNSPGDGPILDINSRDLACNQGGEQPAALIADANAGDVVKVTMNRWPSDHIGFVDVYMANCQGNCMSFDPSKGSVWFKIDEDGMTDGIWGTLKLVKQGNSWSVTIPKSIQAGQYLLRLELVALHNTGRPQFYPFCAQMDIKSSGSSVPSSNDLAAIPGVYNNAGDAINGDAWAENIKSWPVPGPKVVSWAKSDTSGGGGGGYPTKGNSSTSNSTPPVTPSPNTHKPSPTPANACTPKPSSTTRPKRCGKHGGNASRRSVPPYVASADAPGRMVKRMIATNAASPATPDVVGRRSQDDDGMSPRSSEHIPTSWDMYRRHAEMSKNNRSARGMRVPPAVS